MNLSTNRLTIQPATIDDAEFVLRLMNSEGWLKYIGDKNVHTIEEARDYLIVRLVGYNHPHCGMYVIRLKDGTPIGTNSLLKRDFLDTVDIGYALLTEREGKGYATEATTEFLRYVMEDLGYQRVLAYAKKENYASFRILQKLGFAIKETFINNGEECVLMETLPRSKSATKLAKNP
jgi:[ribosomal protein S5]-alanine N-acetyltransferase